MTESDYYYSKASQDKIYSDLQHEAQMMLLSEQQNMNLFTMLNPSLTKDGNQWCVLYGENLQVGIAGFGDSPILAILDFNKQFHSKLN